MEILYRDLAKRSLTEILPGDRLYFRELAHLAWTEILFWDLLQRSCVEIYYRHLAQVALQRDLAQQLLQRTGQGDLAHGLLRRSSLRELAESNLVSLRHVPCNTFWFSCRDNSLFLSTWKCSSVYKMDILIIPQLFNTYIYLWDGISPIIKGFKGTYDAWHIQPAPVPKSSHCSRHTSGFTASVDFPTSAKGSNSERKSTWRLHGTFMGIAWDMWII